MKVALCLSGHFRSYERAFPSLKKAIIDPLNCDIFIHTWDTIGFDGFRGDSSVAQTAININSLQDLFKPLKMEIESEKAFDTTKYHSRLGPGLRNPQIVSSMFYGIFKSNQLKIAYENDNNFIYDTVIRGRADILFENIINNKEIEFCERYHSIFFPKFGNYHGLNDQFAFGCSSSMDLYSSTYPNLDLFFDMGCSWHAESLSKFTVNYFNIPILRSDIQYQLMRVNGDLFRNAREKHFGDVF